MYIDLLWLLLPVAAASGWYVARREYKSKASNQFYELPQDYFKGLNYLLNEQPDKAIDIFLRLSEVDSETVELHLALGSLFRRRGEVDRAIRIHQGLLNRPDLQNKLRNQALLELAQDYMSAGLLDRAENLCLELIDADAKNVVALRLLQDIYQQEKEWFRAIEIVRRIATATDKNMAHIVAHYYCELAEIAERKGDSAQTLRMLSKAIQEDSSCSRAIIFQGDVRREAGQLEAAIQCYKRIEKISPELLPEVIPALLECAAAVGQQRELIDYLVGLSNTYQDSDLMLAAVQLIKQNDGDAAASEFLSQKVMAQPSLPGIQCLLELDGEQGGSVQLQPIKSAMKRLLVKKTTYRCNHCGFVGHEMHWCCPSCKQWSCIIPERKI